MNHNHIIKKTAQYFGFDESEFTSKTRKQEVVTARQICMYLLKKHTVFPLDKIGKMVGKKDHSTVIHSIERVKDLLVTEGKKYNSLIGIIENAVLKARTGPCETSTYSMRVIDFNVL